MGVNIGSNSIGSVFVGASEVSKMYLGNSLIYEKQSSATYTVTITGTSPIDFDPVSVYDGNSRNGTYLGEVSTQDTPTQFEITSGFVTLSSSAQDTFSASTSGGVEFVEYAEDIICSVTGNGAIEVTSYSCFARGTQITLADGTTKNVEDITYDDKLLVWNLYEGKLDKAKPIWIMTPRIAMSYKEVTLSDGTILKLIGEGKKCHRLFNVTKQKFLYANECVGDEVYKQDGTIVKVVKCKIVREWVTYYNLITDKHYNCFANGVLTGQMLNNTYRIEDMKYDTSERLISEQEEADKWASIKEKSKRKIMIPEFS